MTYKEYEDKFYKIKGKTIALVYIFEGDENLGFKHFFIWKSKIIAQWMVAIQELHCMPLLLDVRTFVDKAINKTLPHIDYVLNMNSGTIELSTMALIPAVCASIDVPCIPCDAVSIVTGENKLLSNLIANSVGLQVPDELPSDNPNGIFRPINLGNSKGVRRGRQIDANGVYQEFISGYDITTPIVYNIEKKSMELLPSVLYLPESKNIEWFNGEEIKKTRSGYTLTKALLDEKTVQSYLKLVKTLGIKTFCRIDARVKSLDSIYTIDSNPLLAFENIYFVEINVMPTIRENNNFVFSFNKIDNQNIFYDNIRAQKKFFGNVTLNSFLLVSSMLALLDG